MKFYYKLVILFFINNYVNAQGISGIVIDSITHKPIELANIIFIKTSNGIYTDSNGFFKINSNENKLKLQISSVGYKNKIIDLSNLLESEKKLINIVLVPKIEVLKEVNIIRKKINYTNAKTLGSKKKFKTSCAFQFGTEICNLIKNPFNKNGKIKTVILSLSKMEVLDYLAVFNIKFYKYDTFNNMPGEEIYFKNLVVRPKNKTYKLKIDVDSLSIKFPKDGICIGVEIANTEYLKPKMSMAYVAPYINFTQTDMQILTWKRFKGNTWNVDTHKTSNRIDWLRPNIDKDYMNAMINIEAKIEK